MTAAHVFIITPARRLRWRTGALARQQCRQSLEARCSAYTVCGKRWRRWQWRPPPAKGENSTGCRIDCSAAAMRAGNVVVPERHCRRRITRGSRFGPPAAYNTYVLHFPCRRRRLSSGSGRAVPPRRIVVRKPLHVPPTDTSGRQ